MKKISTIIFLFSLLVSNVNALPLAQRDIDHPKEVYSLKLIKSLSGYALMVRARATPGVRLQLKCGGVFWISISHPLYESVKTLATTALINNKVVYIDGVEKQLKLPRGSAYAGCEITDFIVDIFNVY